MTFTLERSENSGFGDWSQTRLRRGLARVADGVQAQYGLCSGSSDFERPLIRTYRKPASSGMERRYGRPGGQIHGLEEAPSSSPGTISWVQKTGPSRLDRNLQNARGLVAGRKEIK